MALRAENERLRALLSAGRRRRGHLLMAASAELVIGGASWGLLQLLLPLLNAPSDARFWWGVMGGVSLLLADVFAIVVIAWRLAGPVK